MKPFLLQDEFKNWLIGTERTSESSSNQKFEASFQTLAS